MRVLITGGSGFIGSSLIQKILKEKPSWKILSTDIREGKDKISSHNLEFAVMDICNRDSVVNLVQEFQPDSIVHLASILNPPPGMTEEKQREIDVTGTKIILDSAILSKAKQIIITSSGAAYGYHKDNPPWLKETDPIRGHEHFAYSRHKKEVEDMLLEYRKQSPSLKQLILRPGTVLGRTVNNLITDLFKKDYVLGIKGSDSPFVFIWDEDVIDIVLQGIEACKEGIYNLAGDGAVSLPEVARILGKPFRPLPAWLLKGILSIARPLRLSQYGPEQLDFLRYRPVLDNAALKSVFGYTPRYTSKQAFYEFLTSKGVRFHET